MLIMVSSGFGSIATQLHIAANFMHCRSRGAKLNQGAQSPPQAHETEATGRNGIEKLQLIEGVVVYDLFAKRDYRSLGPPVTPAIEDRQSFS